MVQRHNIGLKRWFSGTQPVEGQPIPNRLPNKQLPQFLDNARIGKAMLMILHLDPVPLLPNSPPF